jgi:uncharacterized Zn finger protein (UPF0148 family)
MCKADSKTLQIILSFPSWSTFNLCYYGQKGRCPKCNADLISKDKFTAFCTQCGHTIRLEHRKVPNESIETSKNNIIEETPSKLSDIPVHTINVTDKTLERLRKYLSQEKTNPSWNDTITYLLDFADKYLERKKKGKAHK